MSRTGSLTRILGLALSLSLIVPLALAAGQGLRDLRAGGGGALEAPVAQCPETGGDEAACRDVEHEELGAKPTTPPPPIGAWSDGAPVTLDVDHESPLGYRVGLPAGFARSACLSRPLSEGRARDVFTSVPDGPPTSSRRPVGVSGETPWYHLSDVVMVQVRLAAGRTAMDWAEADAAMAVGQYSRAGASPATVDDREAAFVAFGPYQAAYYVVDGDALYVIGRAYFNGARALSQLGLIKEVAASFRLTSAGADTAADDWCDALAEGGAKSAAELRDRLARALAEGDRPALRSLMDPVGVVFGWYDGQTWLPPMLPLDAADWVMGAGSSLTEVDGAIRESAPHLPPGDLFVRSQWSRFAARADATVDLVFRERGGRWFWSGALSYRSH